jgi:hypothetical protein
MSGPPSTGLARAWPGPSLAPLPANPPSFHSLYHVYPHFRPFPIPSGSSLPSIPHTIFIHPSFHSLYHLYPPFLQLSSSSVPSFLPSFHSLYHLYTLFLTFPIPSLSSLLPFPILSICHSSYQSLHNLYPPFLPFPIPS